MPEPTHNIGASVRARLLNLAKERHQPHELLLTRYALERLLYLSTTGHRGRFVRKGHLPRKLILIFWLLPIPTACINIRLGRVLSKLKRLVDRRGRGAGEREVLVD
jgi:hypothetical protein